MFACQLSVCPFNQWCLKVDHVKYARIKTYGFECNKLIGLYFQKFLQDSVDFYLEM